MFPKIMGPALANEVLLFDKKLTANEALKAGLVSHVFPHVALMDEALSRAQFIASLPQVINGNLLIRNFIAWVNLLNFV